MVGTITNDMLRLREEIEGLRLARQAFMQKDVAGALAALRDGVEDLLGGFNTTRRKVMKASRADRRTFMSDLGDKVVGLRREVANLRHAAVAELKGAHTAFFGSHTARKPTAGSKRSKSKS